MASAKAEDMRDDGYKVTLKEAEHVDGGFVVAVYKPGATFCTRREGVTKEAKAWEVYDKLLNLPTEELQTAPL